MPTSASATSLTSTTAAHLLSIYPHLTPRDRNLLALLDDHQVLTTGQIHRLYFHALRTCQIRLALLRSIGLLERFRFARMNGGSEPWHWTLGLAGARFQAAAAGRGAPTERTYRERVLHLSARAHLPHLLATNEFFVRLHHAARTSEQASLPRWWSERRSHAKFQKIRPDGHGVWSICERTVGFFLEADMQTEPLTRVTAKVDDYAERVHAGGPRYPVLFWLPTTMREANLQHLLRQMAPRVPVATATHDTDPASAVWMPVNGWQRVPLIDLDCDHGRDNANNPNWIHGQLDLSDQSGT